MTAPILRRFPDVQRLLVEEFELFAGAGHTGVETPTDLEGRLPFVRVRRIGGSSDRLNDFATVDVDVFATGYTATELLAEQLRQHLVGPPPPVPMFDRIECTAAPRELPWGDDTSRLRRWGATYRVTSRRIAA